MGFQPFQPAASGTSWQASDYGLAAMTYDPALIASTIAIPNGGKLYTVMVKVGAATTISTIWVYMSAIGSALTSGENFAGVWQGIGGTRIGITADQSTAWTTSGNVGVLQMPLTGGPLAVSAGDVAVGFYVNGTTGPTLSRANSTSVTNVNTPTNSPRFGISSATYTTTPPATLPTLTANNNTTWWVGLS